MSYIICQGGKFFRTRSLIRAPQTWWRLREQLPAHNKTGGLINRDRPLQSSLLDSPHPSLFRKMRGRCSDRAGHLPDGLEIADDDIRLARRVPHDPALRVQGQEEVVRLQERAVVASLTQPLLDPFEVLPALGLADDLSAHRP